MKLNHCILGIFSLLGFLYVGYLALVDLNACLKPECFKTQLNSRALCKSVALVLNGILLKKTLNEKDKKI